MKYFNHQDNQLQTYCVSHVPTTKQNMQELFDKLDQSLQQSFLCPIREELLREYFDDLILQIKINYGERGFIRVTVLTQVRMVIQKYQTCVKYCFWNIKVFIRRRTYLQNIQAEERFKINQLEQECSELQKQVENLEQKLQDINQKNQQNREQKKVTHLKRITIYKNSYKKQSILVIQKIYFLDQKLALQKIIIIIQSIQRNNICQKKSLALIILIHFQNDISLFFSFAIFLSQFQYNQIISYNKLN
ncbi:unnamed protein product [Paramecium pentaurelia]|uniref:Transmembrane protein n=1 Tax=Paramecium pentaurelia TaxID=43138 RepID=A0A8S1XZE2_9CILI|nr:unnamed protein product [Paramecium pentaurelia]